jgi:hypothetical protein
MTMLGYELQLFTTDMRFDPALPPIKPGIAYVPCAICRAAVDLARLTAVEQRPVCERHAPALVVHRRA